MRSPTCLRTQGLLSGRRAGLSELERLAVEEHLTACSSCARYAHDLDALLVLSDSLPSALSDRARERVIEGALAAPGPTLGRARADRRPWLLGAALAASIAIAVASLSSRDEVHDQETEPLATAPQAERAEPPARAPFSSEGGGRRLELAHAIVALSRDTRIEWSEAETTIHLERGRLDVDVDPDPRRTFRVATRTFIVVVLGTRFAVDEHGVEVASGVVRVTDLEGSVLAEAVRAGQRWPETERRHERTKARRKRTVSIDPRDRSSASANVDARERLTSARIELAERKVERARHAIQRALALPLTRTEEAEARTLLAECALADGDRTTAVRLLRDVASEFADLVAGENALFAAARLESEAGDRSAARRLLERYLERYPEGRFGSEVRRRLKVLDLRE